MAASSSASAGSGLTAGMSRSARPPGSGGIAPNRHDAEQTTVWQSGKSDITQQEMLKPAEAPVALQRHRGMADTCGRKRGYFCGGGFTRPELAKSRKRAREFRRWW